MSAASSSSAAAALSSSSPSQPAQLPVQKRARLGRDAAAAAGSATATSIATASSAARGAPRPVSAAAAGPLDAFRRQVATSADRNFLLAVKYAGLGELAAARLRAMARPRESRWAVDTELAAMHTDEIRARLDGRNVALLLFAERDDAGKPWCPDCEVAEPVLRAAFASESSAAAASAHPSVVDLVEVSIPRALWKGARGKQNAFRAAPFGVRGIPTLLHVRDGHVAGGRLGEAECLQEAVVRRSLSLQRSTWTVDTELSGAATAAAVHRRLAAVPQHGRPRVALLLFAERDLVTGRPWCPDCEVAEPALREAFARAGGPVHVVEVVVPRPRWKGAAGKSNVFRKAPFGVRGVPALVEYDARGASAGLAGQGNGAEGAGVVVGRQHLGEEGCASVRELTAFFAALGE